MIVWSTVVRRRAALLAAGLALALALVAPTAHAMPADPSAPTAPEQIASWQGIALAGATCGGPPDARTGQRSPYKYYLNPGRQPDAGILFVLAGGGACLKDGPAPPGAAGIAAQLHCMAFTNFTDGYFNDVTFALDIVASTAIPMFRRDAGNPLRDWTFVAVPYCTGDVHAGRMTEGYDYDPSPDGTFSVLHRGALNVEAVIADVAARVPGDRPVVLTGMSAGGFGAILDFPLFVARWPRTTLVPDAGIAPPAPGSLMLREGARVADRWGARGALPAYCAGDECLGDTLHLLAAHAATYDGGDGRPWRPFGLLQGQQDATLAAYLEISRCSYQQALRRGLDELPDNVRVYVPATDKHVFGAVNPLSSFRSQRGVDPIVWLKALAAATSPDEMPASAVDPWLACNPGFLPAVVAR